MSSTLLLDRPEEITLTPDQELALDGILQFILSPLDNVFVLSGFSGCGKSTLVRILLDRLAGYMKTAKLIDPTRKDLEVQLTATTNKAAENLAYITGMDVSTIHSFLELRVEKDFKTNVSKLVPRNANLKEFYFLVIDEFSTIDPELLGLVFSRTRNCKILFVGDPAQLPPVKAKGIPVADANFPGAKLTTVVRQKTEDGQVAEMHPITTLAAQFRHTVNTGEWLPFKPDGVHVCHVDRQAFDQAILDEFTREGWKYKDSKFLAWTNKCVIDYNQAINDKVKGQPEFQEGDYALVNSYIAISKVSFKTDQLVQITGIGEPVEEHGVIGRYFEVDHKVRAFMPNRREAKQALLRTLRAENRIAVISDIERSWIDLRPSYAQTVDKSQGSTYDRVFIDLDDIGNCNSGDRIARMLYVGVSRARHQVFLTGDLA